VITARENVLSYNYVIENLHPGVGYSVRVSAKNEKGYSYSQNSVPQVVAPPMQKPSEPLDVYVVTSSANTLTVFFKYPESDGGDSIVKYKVEWDTKSTFDSVNGAPFGYHFKMARSDNNCSLVHCSYTISGLEKGTPYYVRVFSYNAFGYSVLPGLPPTLFAVPKTQPAAPVKVLVEPQDSTALLVKVVPPSDDGGAAITHYKVEWDVLGAEAYNLDYVVEPRRSLLYSPYDVQLIATSADDYSLAGYFYVEFGGFQSSKIAIDVSAEDMERKLEAIPTVGDVKVTRSESIDSHGYQWTITFLNSDWWNGERFFDVPQLKLSNLDGTLESDFNTSVVSYVDHSTFGGSTGQISTSVLVKAMDGFEQQSIRMETDDGYLRGYYSLSFHGHRTGFLPVNATETEIVTALSSLPETGKVIVKKQNYVAGNGQGLRLYVVFVENIGNVEMIAVDSSKLFSSEYSGKITVYTKEEVNGLQPIMASMYYGSALVEVASSSESVAYQIENLREGLNYHVRVSAWNGAGNAYGTFKGSTPPLIECVSAPLSVTDVSLVPSSDSSLKASWKAPVSWGSNGLQKHYLVEYDFFPAAMEVQQISITVDEGDVQGTFCLSFGGASTSAIPVDAGASRVESALESLPTIGNVEVTLGTPNRRSRSWIVSFIDNVGDLPAISFSCNNLLGKNVKPAVNEMKNGVDPAFASGSVGIFQRPLADLSVSASKSVQTIVVNTTSLIYMVTSTLSMLVKSRCQSMCTLLQLM